MYLGVFAKWCQSNNIVKFTFPITERPQYLSSAYCWVSVADNAQIVVTCVLNTVNSSHFASRAQLKYALYPNTHLRFCSPCRNCICHRRRRHRRCGRIQSHHRRAARIAAHHSAQIPTRLIGNVCVCTECAEHMLGASINAQIVLDEADNLNHPSPSFGSAANIRSKWIRALSQTSCQQNKNASKTKQRTNKQINTNDTRTIFKSSGVQTAQSLRKNATCSSSLLSSDNSCSRASTASNDSVLLLVRFVRPPSAVQRSQNVRIVSETSPGAGYENTLSSTWNGRCYVPLDIPCSKCTIMSAWLAPKMRANNLISCRL